MSANTDAVRVCPHGDRYAHSITDLIPERAWDPESKPRATEPCPLGFDCPVHQPDTITVTTSGTGPWFPPARPAGGPPQLPGRGHREPDAP